MDVYRFDDETGQMILHQTNNDNFDQIGKFKFDKSSGEYTLKTSRNGVAKTRMDNIEKGILSDGMNFKTNANVWEIGGPGQPTVEGFQDFAIGFSEMIGKEVAGTYYSRQGQNDVNFIHMGSYQNNTYTRSYATPHFNTVRPELIGTVQPHTSWHTHPTHGFSDAARTTYSEQDMRSKINALNSHPTQRPTYFMILTRGYPPIYY